MMNQQKLGIGIMGTGWVARMRHLPPGDGGKVVGLIEDILKLAKQV